MSTFKKIDSPCGMPDATWWDKNCPQRNFNCVVNKGYRVICIDDLKNTNNAGLKVNPARAQGIDQSNVHGLEQSYLKYGFDVTKTPPIVSLDGAVYDGNNRVEALRNLGYQYICVQVVEIKEGFTEDDVFDEIGLGMNNHMVSKSIHSKDAIKRLKLYFERTGTFTEKAGIEWFSRFDHPWSKGRVKDMVRDTINKELVKETMSPYSATAAVKWWKEYAADTDNDTSDNESTPFFFPWSKKNTDTYVARAFLDILEEFDDTSQIRPVVGYLCGYDAEMAPSERERAYRKIRKINKALNLLTPKIKEAHNRGEDFEFISLQGWLPQITGVEEEVVPVE